MAKVNFTAPRVEGFTCGNGKGQAFLWDLTAPGLALRVTANGARAYIFQSQYQGKSLRMTIGRPNVWGIPDAQAKAKALQRTIDDGRDPRAVKAEVVAAELASRNADAAGAVGVAAAWDRYLVEGSPKRRDNWKPRYVADMAKMAAPGGERKVRGKGLTLPGTWRPCWR